MVIEDHDMLRGLFRIACRTYGFEVLGEAADGKEAVDVICNTRPDVVLLDLDLPRMQGLDVIQVIRSKGIAPRFLVVSGYGNDVTVKGVDEAHVHGFILKTNGLDDELRTALIAVASGRRYFCSWFTEAKAALTKDPWASHKVLSPTERVVLILVGKFWSDNDIAAYLGNSTRTIETHRTHIARKLNLHGRVALERYSRERGFANLPVPKMACGESLTRVPREGTSRFPKE